MSPSFYKPLLVFFFVFLSAAVFAQDPGRCDDCYPHEEPYNQPDPDLWWRNPENHGKFAFYNGINENCTACHGADYTGGGENLGVSCYQCHKAFPHPKNWKDPTVHGVWAMTNGYKDNPDTPEVDGNCQNSCHSIDYSGGLQDGDPFDTGSMTVDIPGCQSCHKVPFPHPSDWADTTQTTSETFHGNYVLNTGALQSRACATQCHGTAYDGGLSGRACGDCHAAFPHATNWSRPDTHGVFAVSNGVEKSCGIGCHGKDYKGRQDASGKKIIVGCHDCHENFPHPDGYLNSHDEELASTGDPVACATICHATYPPEKDPNCTQSGCHNAKP